MDYLTLLTKFTVLFIYLIWQCQADCDKCLTGTCLDSICTCSKGYTGTTCNLEYCGEDAGYCDEGTKCIGQECCTNKECFPPRVVSELGARKDKGLPAAGYVGIACLCLMVIAMGVAVVVAKFRCGYFQNIRGARKKDNNPSEKPDGLSTFKPAADVTSIDFMVDVTAEWTRTESNAKLEAEDYEIPYTSASIITNEKTLAWEESDRKLAPLDSKPEDNKSKSSISKGGDTPKNGSKSEVAPAVTVSAAKPNATSKPEPTNTPTTPKAVTADKKTPKKKGPAKKKK